jgi:hypothetical protein
VFSYHSKFICATGPMMCQELLFTGAGKLLKFE